MDDGTFMSIIIIFMGIIALISYFNKVKNYTLHTRGKVVEIVEKITWDRHRDGSPDKDYSYYPVVEYEIDGQTYVEQSLSTCQPRSYQIGQEIDIICNPNEPHKFYLQGDKTSLVVGIFFIVLGVLVPILRS